MSRIIWTNLPWQKCVFSEWGKEKTLECASLLFHFIYPKIKATFQKEKLKPVKRKGREVNEKEETDLAVSYW